MRPSLGDYGVNMYAKSHSSPGAENPPQMRTLRVMQTRRALAILLHVGSVEFPIVRPMPRRKPPGLGVLDVRIQAGHHGRPRSIGNDIYLISPV